MKLLTKPLRQKLIDNGRAQAEVKGGKAGPSLRRYRHDNSRSFRRGRRPGNGPNAKGAQQENKRRTSRRGLYRPPQQMGQSLRDGTRDEAVAKYRGYLLHDPSLIEALFELRGRDLVSWCAPCACHGDVPIELANRP